MSMRSIYYTFSILFEFLILVGLYFFTSNFNDKLYISPSHLLQ